MVVGGPLTAETKGNTDNNWKGDLWEPLFFYCQDELGPTKAVLHPWGAQSGPLKEHKHYWQPGGLEAKGTKTKTSMFKKM
jgi:hypothetical protein